MTPEALLMITLQSSALFLGVWAVFRLCPSIPADWKAWIWRLAFLKPLLSLLPFAVVTLHILPGVAVDGQGSNISYISGTDISSELGSVHSITSPSPQPTSQINPFTLMWILGASAVGFCGLLGLRRAFVVARSASPVTNPTIQAVLVELMDKAQVPPPVHLRASPKVQSAMLVGGFHSTIILPQHVLNEEVATDLRMMLAHEVAHIARRDLTWFSITSGVQALFFFNPMVWLAARLSRLDHESATDRLAAQLAGVSIQTYADMLLRVTVAARIGNAPGVLPMAASYRTIHRRLEAMKHFNMKQSVWRKSGIWVLALTTCGLLPTYQLAQAQDKAIPPKQGSAKSVSSKAIKPSSGKASPSKYKVWMVTKDKKKAWVNSDSKELVAVYAWNGKNYVKLKDITRAQFEKERKQLLKESAKIRGSKQPSSVPPKATTQGKSPSGASKGTSGSTRSTSSSLAAPSSPSGSGSSIGVRGTESLAPTTYATPSSQKASTDTVSIQFNDQEVRGGLDVLLRQTGKAYAISSDVKGWVTLDLNNVSLETALNNIVQQISGSWWIENGVYHISANPKPGRQAHSGVTKASTISELDFQGTDVREALKAISNGAGWTFRIDPSLQGEVHLKLKAVSFEDAIQKVLDQVNGTYRIEDGTYIFKSKA